MKRSFLLVLFCSVLIFTQCKPLKPDGQGITGQVTWLEGNQMPMIVADGKSPDPKAKPKGIKRTIRIYPLANVSDAKMEDSFFISLASTPITEIETDENGKYNITLDPGRYSVLTVEEGGMFASIFDGDGNIQPVTVKEGQWTLLDILVNYKAAY